MRIHNISNDTTFSVEDSTDVMGLKRSIQEHTGVSPNHQKLSHKGHTLQSSKSLAHYHISSDDVLNLQFNLNGGCFECGDGARCFCLPCCIM